ncbi:MAG TPA: aminoglycoside 3'-phosphotransferase [Streptosporangiaceae bacterium]
MIPAVVASLAEGQKLNLVWENEDALTFELGEDPDRRFVKWAPTLSCLDLAAEAERMVWAAPFTPVPRVLATGAESSGSWLITAALPGSCAVQECWKARPATAVRAIGESLRAMHDAMPVQDCPFSWIADERVERARRAAAASQIDPVRDWQPEHLEYSIPEALELIADIPPVDRLVVCHGDSCAPNTILTDDGRCSGHVDLGALGVADRWADLAIATWSTTWNYGPGWEGELLDAYGLAPDQDRTSYYRLLWDLSP